MHKNTILHRKDHTNTSRIPLRTSQEEILSSKVSLDIQNNMSKVEGVKPTGNNRQQNQKYYMTVERYATE